MTEEKLSRNQLLCALGQLDEYAGYKGKQLPALYLLGGTAGILADYLSRATLDMDLLDVGFQAEHGFYLRLLGKTDLLDLNFTSIPPDFRERAIKMDGFTSIEVFVLCVEDLILSKLGRYDERDREDIDQMLQKADKRQLALLAEKTAKRKDLSPRVRDAFLKNWTELKGEGNV